MFKISAYLAHESMIKKLYGPAFRWIGQSMHALGVRLADEYTSDDKRKNIFPLFFTF